MEIETLEDTRWSCRGCGACCRGFAFGPVEPDIIAGLEAADIAARWPPAAEGPWYETVPAGPERTPTHYLVSRDGHCVFLQEDARCAIHRLLGAAAKPWFCREYPFYPVDLPGGRVSVMVRGDCGGLHESFEDGEPVAPQAAAVLSLPRSVPRPRFDAAQVVLLPGAAIPAATWEQLQPHLLQHLSVPRAPEAAVATTRARLYELAGRPMPPPDAEAYRAALGHLVGALHAAEPQPVTARVSARLAAGAPLPPLDEPSMRYLGIILRGELLACRFDQVGGLPVHLGLFLLETAVARLHTEAPAPLTPHDLGETLPAFKRHMHHPAWWQVLQQQRRALEGLFRLAVE